MSEFGKLLHVPLEQQYLTLSYQTILLNLCFAQKQALTVDPAILIFKFFLSGLLNLLRAALT
jgi:hypothetical protein